MPAGRRLLALVLLLAVSDASTRRDQGKQAAPGPWSTNRYQQVGNRHIPAAAGAPYLLIRHCSGSIAHGHPWPGCSKSPNPILLNPPPPHLQHPVARSGTVATTVATAETVPATVPRSATHTHTPLPLQRPFYPLPTLFSLLPASSASSLLATATMTTATTQAVTATANAPPANAAVRAKPTLPPQWADEIALAASPITMSVPDPQSTTAPSSSSPPNTSGTDRRLDDFLERFQAEIGIARDLKEGLDRISRDNPSHADLKNRFKLKMERIRDLFSTEGEDFVDNIERHNPKLLTSACGQNTIELAKGIDRLETAVKEEEGRRAIHQKPLAPSVLLATSSQRRTPPPQPSPTGASITPPAQSSPDRAVIAPLGSTPPDRRSTPSFPGTTVGHTINKLTSDETLQLMQSDIVALKLELLRLQRTKANATSFATVVPHSLPSHSSSNSVSRSPYSVSSLSPDKPPTSGVPASLLNNNVNVVRVTGRANAIAPTYVSHLEQMKSRLEALEKKPLRRRAKSAARLGRTQTMGSMYDTTTPPQNDENRHPNVSAMVTPPRNAPRRPKHRSVSTQSPLMPLEPTPVPPPMTADTIRASPPSHATPSPERFAVRVDSTSPRTTSASPSGMSASGSPARLFFDGPEDMLARPQSRAAARDIQRYSLKVARRFVPAGLERGQVGSPGPRAKSAITVSPSRQKALLAGGVATSPTISDVGTGGNTVGPPSTIDTQGSGGRVVEEIEGDMWVRKGVFWKRWRRRYASIVSHQFFGKVMCLFSYDAYGGVISTRSQIVVLNGSLCRALRDHVEIGGAERFMFVLRTSSKEYYFAAESEAVRRNWIRELRDAALIDNGRLVHSKGRSMTFRKNQ